MRKQTDLFALGIHQDQKLDYKLLLAVILDEYQHRTGKSINYGLFQLPSDPDIWRVVPFDKIKGDIWSRRKGEHFNRESPNVLKRVNA